MIGHHLGGDERADLDLLKLSYNPLWRCRVPCEVALSEDVTIALCEDHGDVTPSLSAEAQRAYAVIFRARRARERLKDVCHVLSGR
jgi:hypothetical protein